MQLYRDSKAFNCFALSPLLVLDVCAVFFTPFLLLFSFRETERAEEREREREGERGREREVGLALP